MRQKKILPDREQLCQEDKTETSSTYSAVITMFLGVPPLVAVLHNQTLLCSHTGPNPKITCKQRHRVLFFDVEFILHIVFWFCETLTDRLYRCWSEQTKPPTYHVLVKPKKMQ